MTDYEKENKLCKELAAIGHCGMPWGDLNASQRRAALIWLEENYPDLLEEESVGQDDSQLEDMAATMAGEKLESREDLDREYGTAGAERALKDFVDSKVNLKAEASSGKAPLHLIPSNTLIEIAWAFKEGADKYGAFNWRKEDVVNSTYVSAALRHIHAWQEGEVEIDPTSPRHVSHITKAIASLMILLDGHIRSALDDDRP